MDEHRRQLLQWLSDQYFEEISTLQANEDHLFTWSVSTLMASLGALTGLRGIADGHWSVIWRLLLWGGLIAALLAILFMAYLLNSRAEQHRRDAAQVLAQIDPLLEQAPRARPGDVLLFYVRWGVVLAIGIVVLMLIYLLG